MNRGVERPSLNDGGAADGLNENFSQKKFFSSNKYSRISGQ